MYTQMKVRFVDGSESMIDAQMLEEMLDAGEISHFRRSDGWVDVIGARTRCASRGKPDCHERRRDVLTRRDFFGDREDIQEKPANVAQPGRMSRLLKTIYRAISS